MDDLIYENPKLLKMTLEFQNENDLWQWYTICGVELEQETVHHILSLAIFGFLLCFVSQCIVFKEKPKSKVN